MVQAGDYVLVNLPNEVEPWHGVVQRLVGSKAVVKCEERRKPISVPQAWLERAESKASNEIVRRIAAKGKGDAQSAD